MDRTARTSRRNITHPAGAGRNRAAAILRVLVWPPALAHALYLETLREGTPVVIAAVAGMALVSMAAFSVWRRRADPGSDRLALVIEILLAVPVVGLTGGAGSPWLVLYGWLILDRWRGDGALRPALFGVPASYALALWLGGMSLQAVPAVAAQVALFLLLAAFVIRGPGARASAESRRSTPSPAAADNGAMIAEAIEDMSAAASRIAPDADSGSSDAASAVRVLGDTLRLLDDPSRAGRDDLTFARFSLAELVETTCADWALVANLRERDIYPHVATSLPDSRFGDRDRLRAILNLLLMAGCYRPGSSGVQLTVNRAGDAGAREWFEVTLDGGQEPAPSALHARLGELVHELGGRFHAGENGWTLQLALDLQESEAGVAAGALSGTTVHVSGGTPLAPVLQDYARAEGARLIDDPAEATVALLAASTRGSGGELHCREFRQRFPRVKLLCQGVTGGMRGGILLEADGVLPMPITRRGLVNAIRECAAEMPRRRATPESATRSSPQVVRTDGPARVLVAEDDAISARVVTRFLESEGIRVQRVADGESALQALQGNGIRLALLDMHMPGLSGVEVARALRGAETEHDRPRTPLVALTASAADEDRRACEEAGMDGFLNKPVDRDALRRVLVEHLQEESTE